MHHQTLFRNVFVAAASGLLLLAGCASEPPAQKAEKPALPDAPPVPERNEVVLDDGTRLVATTPQGTIKVDAGPGLLRRYTWDGATRAVVMRPREERHAGSLGIHYEGTPPDWKPHNGIRKVKVEEGQRHFDNQSDAKIWMQIRRLHYVHTSNGLVVGWKRKGDTLQVEVWQFYIGGDKPAYLPGAKDSVVQVSRTSARAGR